MHEDSQILHRIPETDIDPMLTAQQAAEIVGISHSSFWRRVADGTFPPPVKLGSLSRWPRSEVIAALERLKVARCLGIPAHVGDHPAWTPFQEERHYRTPLPAKEPGQSMAKGGK